MQRGYELKKNKKIKKNCIYFNKQSQTNSDKKTLQEKLFVFYIECKFCAFSCDEG